MPPSQPVLPTNRAFLVQFRTPPTGEPPSYAGRVEHVVSGQMARFHSPEGDITYVHAGAGGEICGSPKIRAEKGRRLFMNYGRILVVDDDPRIRMLLTRVLKMEQLEVQTAPDSATALDLCATRTFALFLIDYLLPGMDGLALARAIRSQHPDLPMALITGRHLGLDHEDAIEYITMPQ